MLELESRSRARGVTSDLSLGGCFVCARCTLDIYARVRGTLTHGNKKVRMLAVVCVVIPRVGMGLEFLDTDPDANATLLTSIENLRKLRRNTPSHQEIWITLPRRFFLRGADTIAVMRFDR